MMKRFNTASTALSAMLVLALGISGCIKPEAPNAEADILTCEVAKELLFRSTSVSNDKVEIMVNAWTDVTKLAPKFTLTEGAKIEPESGTPRDFTSPQKYTVTSEDGKWQKTYVVTAKRPSNEEQPVWTYSFEGLVNTPTPDGSKTYPTLAELNEKGEVVLEWASGNFGAILSRSTFYTTQEEHGVKGKAAKLETLSTGPFGSLVKKPIAAGSIFLGEFDPNRMITEPTAATHFGIPFHQKPYLFEGYYKYTPGEKVTNAENKVIEGAVDTFSIYAIFYETTDEIQWLDGNNALTSEQLIAVAEVTNKVVGDKWVKFSIPFTMKEDKSIDQEKLKAGKYNISIVASSSAKGATFEGAIGSTLWVDELQIFCK
ncbi:PCMD domain-containing protein [Porphyromonas levii]|uniref:PCMD domain-containing protein n=1 Tax=Porphyromonas levii TaxID=28114 RepID=UPI002011D921|nr:PCMD domain-containing protein [Porphyromonas levii]